MMVPAWSDKRDEGFPDGNTADYVKRETPNGSLDLSEAKRDCQAVCQVEDPAVELVEGTFDCACPP